MKYTKHIIASAALLLSGMSLSAQHTKSGYFLDG